jgi:DNA repair ATPase RecN
MSDRPGGTLTLDGQRYEIDSLSDEARNVVRSIQFCDDEIAQLQRRQAALQTARQAYLAELRNQLGTTAPATGDA